MSDHDSPVRDGPVPDSPITFEEFRRMIADELHVEEGLVVPEASFVDTLYADSIRLVEMMLHLKQRGISIVFISHRLDEVLGIADRGLFFSIIDRCHERDTRGALGLFNAYYDGGGDLKEFVEGLLIHLRDLLYARFEGGLDQVMLSDDMLTRLKSQSEWFHQGDIIRMIQYVTEVDGHWGDVNIGLQRLFGAYAG